MSFLDHFSILAVTNVIHEPFQDVDRLGLAISKFGPGFLEKSAFCFRVVQVLYPEQIIGMLRVAKVVRMTFFGGNMRSLKIN